MHIGDNRLRGVTRGEREDIPNNGSRTNVGINVRVNNKSNSGINSSEQIILAPASDSIRNLCEETVRLFSLSKGRGEDTLDDDVDFVFKSKIFELILFGDKVGKEVVAVAVLL